MVLQGKVIWIIIKTEETYQRLSPSWKSKQNYNTSQFWPRVIKPGKLMTYLVQSWRPVKQVISLSVSKLEEKEHGVLIYGSKGESYYYSITEIINSYFLYCIVSLSSQFIWWKYLHWWQMPTILGKTFIQNKFSKIKQKYCYKLSTVKFHLQ